MNKMLIVLFASVVLVGSGIAYFLMQDRSEKNDAMLAQVADISNDANVPMANDEPKATVKAAGAYKDYTAEAVKADTGTKILFFHAPWCPQCQDLDKDIKKNISNESGVTIYKVDYDTNQALRKKYGVTLQTTLVTVDDTGNLVKKFVAYDEPTYASVAANLL